MAPLLARSSHRPACLPPGRRVYAIGDVHGEAALLARLLAQISRDVEARGPADTSVVFLGDIVDRGPQGAPLIVALAEAADEQVVFLKGNHEHAMVEAWRGNEQALGFWLAYGGRQTLAGFGLVVDVGDPLAAVQARLPEFVPEALIDWLDALPTSWTCGDYFFAHAGVRPGVPLARQRDADLLWIREPFLSSKRRHGKVVVHGHTIEPGMPALGGVRIGVDTGASALGRLTALGLEDDRQWLLQAVREPAEPPPHPHEAAVVA